MGLIEKAAKATGMDIVRDVPIKGQRRCKDWATLIGMARKLESTENEEAREALIEVRKLTGDLATALQAQHNAEREREQLRLKLKIIQGDFSQKDSKYLLEEVVA